MTIRAAVSMLISIACAIGCGDDDAEDPFCHYDCSGSLRCVDGTIYRKAGGPVACRDWTGSCNTHEDEIARCELGCRTDGMTELWETADPAWLCEETRSPPRPAPPDDWLSACSADLTGLTGGGAVRDRSCTSGWCIFEASDTCDRHGCTALCGDDADCPAGSACIDARAYEPAADGGLATGSRSVCWPVSSAGSASHPSDCRP